LLSNFEKLISKLKFLFQKSLLRISPNFVLILCLAITTFSTYLSNYLIHREVQAQFEREVKTITAAIETRLQIYKNVLISTRGLFNASQYVSREAFRDFIKGFDLETTYPGIRGVGYAPKVLPHEIQKHIAEIKKSGLPDYSPWPLTNSPDIFHIIYLEPVDWRNKRALGYDMYSEPIRRDAMARARDTGNLATTGRVILIQETKQNPQPGFLVYIPVYKKNMPVDTVENRRKAIQGFVYSPFRAPDLFNQIQKEMIKDDSAILMEVFDGTAENPNALLYSSETEHPVKSAKFSHLITIPLFMADHTWTLKIQADPSNKIKFWTFSPWAVAIFGYVLSFLIFSFLRFLKRLNNNLKEDLLRQRASEEQIRIAQKASDQANEAKSRFLATITHEIRTPIGIIMGFADLALDASDLKSETKNYLMGIKRNGNLLLNLIGDVLDLSKIEANKMELEIRKISLIETLDDIMSSLNLLAQEKGLNLHLVKEEPLPATISTDPMRFRQILMNLIGNAIKFTEKGQVTLTVKMLSEKSIGVPIQLEFEIKDTGMGISPEFMKNIFQPFAQAELSKNKTTKGTGLGLVLSKQFAKALGGDVDLIESTLGKGSTFRFLLQDGLFTGAAMDKRSDDLNAEAEAVVEDPLLLKGLKVLLAEDSNDNQLLISKYLKPTEILLDFANDGVEAVNLASKNNYDVILMDIQMPNMDGYEATQILRKQGFNNQIVALTAHAFQEERERIMNGGFNLYLTKPISRRNLIKEIALITGRIQKLSN
jgi:signal transduction histidine kinase/AmiR/NasT family two-component response regulator